MFGKEKQITVFDIGSKNMKILTGHVKDKLIVVEEYEIITTPENTISDGKIIDREKIIAILCNLKIKSKDIRIVLSSNDIVLRTFDLPKMELDEVREAVKFEMSVLLPDDLENYIVDSNIIEEYVIEKEDDKISMLKVQGVVVERQIVEDYLECFSKAGYKINIVDIQSNSIIKLMCSENNFIMSKMKTSIAGDNLAIIDMGHEKTSITFVQNRKIFLHRILNQGGRDITELISQTLDLNLQEAQEWKHQNNFEFLLKSTTNEVESILNDKIATVFNDLTLEIYQVIEFFNSMSKQKKIDHIIVIGGGSCIPTIDQYMENYLNINTEVIDELHNIKIKSLDDASIIANALGAFIRRG